MSSVVGKAGRLRAQTFWGLAFLPTVRMESFQITSEPAENLREPTLEQTTPWRTY